MEVTLSFYGELGEELGKFVLFTDEDDPRLAELSGKAFHTEVSVQKITV